MTKSEQSLTNVPKSEFIIRIDNILKPFIYRAYEDYKKAFHAGDDGRPDWMARKSCNYMTAAVEVSQLILFGFNNDLSFLDFHPLVVTDKPKNIP